MNQRIIYVIPARLGDAVMTTSVVALMKQYEPETIIDVIGTTVLGASVFENNPHIDQIYVADKVEDLANLAKDYAKVIVSHVDRKTMALAEALGIEVVHAEDPDQGQAQAPQAMNFIHRLHKKRLKPTDINYELYPSQTDIDYIKNQLNKSLGNLEYYTLIACHLGCHGIAKKNLFRSIFKRKHHPKVWPLKYFVKLEKLLQAKNPKIRFVLTGGPSETNLADMFMKKSKNAIDLVGKTSTLQLAALNKFLSAYISSDTGAMHVACAMSTPLVALFGPTNLVRTGPYPKANFRKVLVAEDMSKISPQKVCDEVLALINHA